MIVLDDILQGSPEWHRARCGVFTASRCKDVITPAKRELSKMRRKYIAELVAELLTGVVQEDFLGNVHTERGLDLQPEAMDAYALATDLEPRIVGIVYKDETRRTGCSPDWLVDGDTGGAEVKCPAAKTHVLHLLDGGMPVDHRPQVEFSLWVTGLPWWDYVSYYPGLPPLIDRIHPTPAWQDALSEHVPAFLAEMDLALAMLRDGT